VKTSRLYRSLLSTMFLTCVISGCGKSNSKSDDSSNTGVVSLMWDASEPQANDPNVVIGYRIRYGTVSGVYTFDFDAGTQLNAIITGLKKGTVYHFVAQAYAAGYTDSIYSNEVISTAPPRLDQKRILGVTQEVGIVAR
jgi:hypothetical protein